MTLPLLGYRAGSGIAASAPGSKNRRRELMNWIENAAERALRHATEAESRGEHEIARLYRLRASLRQRTARSLRERRPC